MKKNSISLQKIWENKFKKDVYSCAIADLIGDPLPEIIGCSFDETMRIYNLQGKQVMSSEFSPEITSLILARITQDDETELVSGDIKGNLRVMSKQGRLLWNVKLKSAIICIDVGDFTKNGKNEIIVGLQNKKIIIVNNQGEVTESFMLPEMANDCTILNNSGSLLGNLIVLLKSGGIINYDKKGRWQEIFQLDDNPTALKSLFINDTSYFLIGNKVGSLKIVDLDGYILGEIQLGEKIRCINCMMQISANEDYNYITAAASNVLYLIRYKISKILIEVKSIKKEKIKIQKPEMKSDVIIADVKTDLKREIIPELINTKDDFIHGKTPIEALEKQEMVKVTRGGQIEGDRYIFKIKVINERDYNITDVNIQILSYPSDSITLYQGKRDKQLSERSVDRIKINKITKGGFVSPSFIFVPKSDCIKGVIQAVVNYIDEKDQVKTIIVSPYDIRVICGLLKPKPITLEEFERFSHDLINFEKVGEELEVLINPNLLYEKLLVLLKKKILLLLIMKSRQLGGIFLGY